MQSVGRRDTVPELLLRKELHRRRLHYRVDTKPLPNLRRKADIVFRSARVAVFVDGCFWHFCLIHRSVPKSNYIWWRAKLERRHLRDAEINIEERGSTPGRKGRWKLLPRLLRRKNGKGWKRMCCVPSN